MDRYEAVCARLEELRQKQNRRRKVESMLRDLEEQRQDLLTWEESLAQAWSKEEKDVDKLEKGLSGFVASLLGGKEAKLEKEKAEAYAARLRYDAKVRERQDVEYRMGQLQRELDGFSDMEREYRALLEEKKQLLIGRSGPAGSRIQELEEQIARIRGDRKEVEEALFAGRGVQTAIDQALHELDTAEGYGLWDMWGGGTISTLMKHGAMNDARNQIERVQWNLSRFSTELRDVQMYIDVDLPTDGLLGFADLFFDNFFTDMMVQDRIVNTKQSVLYCAGQVDRVMARLEGQQKDLDQREQELQHQIQQLVAEA